MKKFLSLLTLFLTGCLISSGVAGGAIFAGVALASSLVAPTGSLMTLITPADITWNGKEVMSMAQAILTSTFNNPSVESMHTVIENIVAKEQIAYLGRLEKITKADAGCGSGKTTKDIPITQKFWDPAKVKIWLHQCADDLEESFFVWGLKKGIDRKDLTSTDFAEFIMIRVEEASLEDALRIVWFGDVDASDVDASPAGTLTSGTDVTDYNILDGLWKQIFAIVTADPDRRYTITENGNVTYVLQDTLSADRAIVTMRTLLQNADKRLKNAPNKVLFLTDSLIDNYMTYLESQAVDASFQRIQGEKVGPFDTGLSYRGVKIYRVEFWDRIIRADYDNGTTWFRPHRALLTTIDNLLVGVDKASELKKWKVYFDDETEETNFKGGYKLDAKIKEDHMIQVAY